jgi:hypothetical protein
LQEKKKSKKKTQSKKELVESADSIINIIEKEKEKEDNKKKNTNNIKPIKLVAESNSPIILKEELLKKPAKENIIRLEENNDYSRQKSPKYRKEVEEKPKRNLNSNMVLPSIHGIGSVRMQPESKYNRNDYHSVEK